MPASASDNRQSYLPSSLGNLSPWSSRSNTPKPPPAATTPGDATFGKQQASDHAINRRHRLHLKDYPRDCPPLEVRWFYAVDVPKRKPLPLAQPASDAKPPPPPKKFVPFSLRDSRSIEKAFQKFADDEEAKERDPARREENPVDLGGTDARNTAVDDSSSSEHSGKVKVPVNEDYLFDVDIERRELAPVYWLGPIYEVRRGTWFYQEGSTLRTCDENLATQLEEGYLKVKPFRYATPKRSSSQPPAESTSSKEDAKSKGQKAPESGLTSTSSADSLKDLNKQAQAPTSAGGQDSKNSEQQLQTHRLFGAHLNSVVTYQDATTAWILTDDFLSRMSSNVYQHFAGGGYLGGVKVVRGYSEPGKGKETKPEGDKKAEESPANAAEGDKAAATTRLESPEKMDSSPDRSESSTRRSAKARAEPPPETRRQALERTMSSMVSSTEAQDPEKQEEEARRRDEKEIRDDYRGQDSEKQDREVEHLVLVTHGIGQRLGLRMESVNFIHDVNVLRKTVKGVYASSADLQALNSEVEKLPKNSRIQVLPVCWRHLLDFPRQRKQGRKEHDLGEMRALAEEEEEYPSLEDITVEGVPAVRNLITDLALDILLYQSSYRDHIAGIVLRECNRIYRLFLDRNPNFKGQVSLIGHSLGSAILFDILCDQKSARSSSGIAKRKHAESRDLDFDAINFFCLGSPIGLFQMLRGRTIAGRKALEKAGHADGSDPASMDDPFLGASSTKVASSRQARRTSDLTHLPFTVSSPKCSQLFNIFHPTDPISYRIEPLISPAMAPLKPQPLPYTKKGLFGAPMGQGLTGIGARVGQSVTGLWTSFSSGIANSILNRSLGLTAEEGQRLALSANERSVPLSVGAGTNIAGGGVISTVSIPGDANRVDDSKKRKVAKDASDAGQTGAFPPTLIDAEMETLYAGFEKRRKSHQSDESRDLGESPEWQASEQRGRRLRREEDKVRALNSNGRVDFSIQE